MLAWIERHNLFLSALDEQGYWFRYHPLLQENLRTMLQQNNDIDRKQLHELASQWFVEQKLWSEAVRHALSAGKPVHSPVQDGASAQSLAEEGDIDTLISWMHHLPPSTDPSRIDLQINRHGHWRIISTLMSRGSCLITSIRWYCIIAMI